MTLDNTSIFFAREGNLLSQAWNKLNSDKRSNISFRLDNLDINYAENESWCLHEIARVKKYPNIYLKEILTLPWLHVDLTLVDVVNVGKIW